MIGFPNPLLPSGLLGNLCPHSRGRSVRSTLFWTSPRGIGLRPWHIVSCHQPRDLYLKGSTDSTSTPLQSLIAVSGVFKHVPSPLGPHSIWTQQGTGTWLGFWPSIISISRLLSGWASHRKINEEHGVGHTLRTNVLRTIKLQKCHTSLALVNGFGIHTMPVIKSKQFIGILHRYCTQRALDVVRPSTAILTGERFGKNSDRRKSEEKEAIEGLHLDEWGSKYGVVKFLSPYVSPTFVRNPQICNFQSTSPYGSVDVLERSFVDRTYAPQCWFNLTVFFYRRPIREGSAQLRALHDLRCIDYEWNVWYGVWLHRFLVPMLFSHGQNMLMRLRFESGSCRLSLPSVPWSPVPLLQARV